MTRLTPGVRIFLLATLVVIVPLGLLLYALPTQTATYWMWVMHDPRSAMLFGPVYLGASVFYIVALRENDWLQTQAGLQGLFVVSFLLLIPVALNWDTVRAYHPMTLIWLPVYYAPLFLVPILWRAQEQQMGRPTPSGPQLPAPWRAWLIARGIFYLGLTVAGFVFGDELSALFPWDLGALNLQMFLGQPATLTLPTLAMLRGNYFWRPQRLHMLYAASLGVLQLAALALAPSPYNASAPLAFLLPLMFAEWLITPLLLFLQFDRRS